MPSQAVLQQTPSAQNPDKQSSPTLHGPRPLGSLPQALPAHFKPAEQSPSVAQLERHWPSAQPYGQQTTAGPGLQAPLPSQMLRPEILPESQVPARQLAPATYRRQPPSPAQVPSRPQELAAWAGHSIDWRGFPPGGTMEQVPSEPGRLHEVHLPEQAVVQQTPSAQMPVVQSEAHWHGSPAAEE